MSQLLNPEAQVFEVKQQSEVSNHEPNVTGHSQFATNRSNLATYSPLKIKPVAYVSHSSLEDIHSTLYTFRNDGTQMKSHQRSMISTGGNNQTSGAQRMLPSIDSPERPEMPLIADEWASVEPNHRLYGHMTNAAKRTRNLAHQSLNTDWHCRGCGTSYTGDVGSCVLCVNRNSFRSIERSDVQAWPDSTQESPESNRPLNLHYNQKLSVGNAASPPRSFEMYPSPTTTLEKLSKHVQALVKIGQSGIGLKDVLVEGDISLCMDLGMKGLIGREALNPWKSLSINIPDQPFMKQIPKPPLGSVAGDWTCSCGRENWAKRTVCSRCFPGIEPEYKAIVYDRVRPVLELLASQMREVYTQCEEDRLTSEERRLRREQNYPPNL